MKKILFVFAAIVALFFASCSSKPSDTPTSTYQQTDTTWADKYDSTPVYTNGVAHTEYAKVSRYHPIVTMYTIEPTWGQAFHYAFKSGYGVTCAIGIILILLGVGLITLDQFDKFDVLTGKLGLKAPINPYVKMVLFFAILAAGAITFYAKPGDIKSNNEKHVSATYFQNKGAQPIWDSLENNNLIIGASH